MHASVLIFLHDLTLFFFLVRSKVRVVRRQLLGRRQTALKKEAKFVTEKDQKNSKKYGAI